MRYPLPFLVPLGVVGFASLQGCFPACGDYTALTGLEMVVEGVTYDFDRDDMFESCGAGFGATGTNVLSEGLGALTLFPDHRDMEIDTHICTALYYHVLYDPTSMVAGGELSIVEGEAGIYAVQAVPLASGTVEVLDSKDADPECTPFREQQFRLAWDLEYTDNTGLRYTATGEDWVGVSLAMDSSDPGC